MYRMCGGNRLANQDSFNPLESPAKAGGGFAGRNLDVKLLTFPDLVRRDGWFGKPDIAVARLAPFQSLFLPSAIGFVRATNVQMSYPIIAITGRRRGISRDRLCQSAIFQ